MLLDPDVAGREPECLARTAMSLVETFVDVARGFGRFASIVGQDVDERMPDLETESAEGTSSSSKPFWRF
jgi:hypothetical protein